MTFEIITWLRLDFTPVATTELVNISELQTPFANRGVKLLALSTNNQPDKNGEYVQHEVWVNDVNSLSSDPLAFPIVNDRDGKLSRLFNVYASKLLNCAIEL